MSSPIHLDDPVKRLKSVSEVMKKIKVRARTSGWDLGHSLAVGLAAESSAMPACSPCLNLHSEISTHNTPQTHSVHPKGSYRPRWRIHCPTCRAIFCASRWPSIRRTFRSCARTSQARRTRCTWTALLSTTVCRLPAHVKLSALHGNCLWAMSSSYDVSRYQVLGLFRHRQPLASDLPSGATMELCGLPSPRTLALRLTRGGWVICLRKRYVTAY